MCHSAEALCLSVKPLLYLTCQCFCVLEFSQQTSLCVVGGSRSSGRCRCCLVRAVVNCSEEEGGWRVLGHSLSCASVPPRCGRACRCQPRARGSALPCLPEELSFPEGRSPSRFSAQGGVYRFLQKICGILIFIPSRTRKLNPNHCSKA